MQPQHGLVQHSAVPTALTQPATNAFPQPPPQVAAASTPRGQALMLLLARHSSVRQPGFPVGPTRLDRAARPHLAGSHWQAPRCGRRAGRRPHRLRIASLVDALGAATRAGPRVGRSVRHRPARHLARYFLVATCSPLTGGIRLIGSFGP